MIARPPAAPPPPPPLTARPRRRYHHVSVLLYCWHSYSSRIGTGLWFASMNYSVHAMMYFYFGLTQTGPRGKALARRFSMAITSLQLAQMVVGIAVTVASMVYHASGAVCHVSLVNSLLGLAMYVSYFLLFLQLFLRSYVWKTRKPEPRAGARTSGWKSPLKAE